jgi:putative glutamine amidotransferase
MRPVIAVSCYLEPARWGAWDVEATLLHRQYVDALHAVGAVPLLVPPGTDSAGVTALLARVDALVLTGGPDVDPARYGADAHPSTDAPRLSRDDTELTLYRQAVDRGLPVLGICRGMQVMAVASGGTLIQDLPSAGYGVVHRDRPATFHDHEARFLRGSRIAEILQTEAMTVNSSHHQAVADAGSLTVTGHADDGTIEVVELPSARFVLGVQWHPEMTDDRRLFAALAAAAS